MEYDQKEEEAAAEAVLAEVVKDPFIEKTGVYMRTIGKEKDAIITALVRNPNDKTYIGSLHFDYTLYDADNNIIESFEADNTRCAGAHQL